MAALGQGAALGVMLPVLTLHELGHVLAAQALGVRVAAVELTPFGGVARLEGWKQLPPWQAGLIAACGPLTNLVLLMAAVSLAHYGVVGGPWVTLFIRGNIVLMLFNLLPAFPMDGGRMMHALLSGWLGEQGANRLLAGCGIGLGLAVLGLTAWVMTQGVLNLSLGLIGCYLIYAALRERNTPAYTQLHRALRYRQRLDERGAMPARHWVVRGDLPVEKLAQRLDANSYHDIQVVDEALRPLGAVDEQALLRALLDRPGSTVGEVLRR